MIISMFFIPQPQSVANWSMEFKNHLKQRFSAFLTPALIVHKKIFSQLFTIIYW